MCLFLIHLGKSEYHYIISAFVIFPYLIFRQFKTAEDFHAPYKSEQKVLVGINI